MAVALITESSGPVGSPVDDILAELAAPGS